MNDSMPVAISLLAKNKVGYPIPWFVWVGEDGVPDFRVVKPGAIQECLEWRLCWICGQRMLGRENRTFVIGPMCAVNRVSAEPPSHFPCAVYAATHCPFLVHPNMRRRPGSVPDGAEPPGGFSILRNPGVALVWASRFDGWGAFDDGHGKILFDVGEPRTVRWYAEGRAATRAEVLASIESGLPVLLEEARKDDAEDELEAMRLQAVALAPTA